MKTPFLMRCWRASLFHAETYEEVEADRGASSQAFLVVVLSAVGAGIGSLSNNGWEGLVVHFVAAVLGWYIWAYLTYFIGTRLLPGPETEADHGELLRTIGFSSAPGMLRVFMVIPGLAFPLLVVSTLWMFATMVVAVRQALDYSSTGRALAVCAVGFPIYALLLALSTLALGPWPI